MPLYEYECEACGVFTALRSMAESSAPACCDSCGSLSPRIMSAPKLSFVDKATRTAHERNEKSAHAPDVKKRSSCGCSGAHTCKSSTAINPKTGTPALQMQTKKTARPWMLAH